MPKSAITLATGATQSANNNGPSTDPCGTPYSLTVHFDCWLPTRINCDRLLRYDFSQSNAQPEMPKVCSARSNSVSMSIVSNAADKSNCTSSVLALLSALQYTSFRRRSIAVFSFCHEQSLSPDLLWCGFLPAIHLLTQRPLFVLNCLLFLLQTPAYFITREVQPVHLALWMQCMVGRHELSRFSVQFVQLCQCSIDNSCCVADNRHGPAVGSIDGVAPFSLDFSSFRTRLRYSAVVFCFTWPCLMSLTWRMPRYLYPSPRLRPVWHFDSCFYYYYLYYCYYKTIIWAH